MKLSLVTFVTTISLVVGCKDQPNVTITSAPAGALGIPAASVMNSSDLDLSTIASLIRDGKVTDAASLQAAVNDQSTGINNVDTDKNGQVDPVSVQEVQTPTGKQFNLVANPANGQQVTIANINITQSGSVATVNAGYSAYVNGYQDNYYSYNTAANLAFLYWALSPRPFFVPAPYSTWYHPYRVYDTGSIARTRTTYSTTTRVSPIQRSAPPPDFATRAQAQRLPPAALPRTTPTTNNLNDRATARDFTVRDQSAPVQRATGFGARTPAPAPAVPARTGASFGGGGSSPRPSVSPSSRKK